MGQMKAKRASQVAISPRDQNRMAVMELIFREPGIVRSAVQELTGLSRATIFRVVDELTSEGYLVESPTARSRTRGRPKMELFVSPAQGYVAGVDIGVLTTRLMISDLNGYVLARRRVATPPRLSTVRLASWLAKEVSDFRMEVSDHGLLVRAVISLPARIGRDRSITRPSGHLVYLDGSDFLAIATETLGVPTDLRSDPEMALLGEMQIGRASGFRDVAMFVMGSSLSASVAVDGAILSGRSGIIGEFGSMPIGDGRRLADLLTAPGILAYARECGLDVATLEDLLESATSELLAEVRARVKSGLVTAIAAIALSVDPEIIVITGSVLPFVSDVLGEAQRDLEKYLSALPSVALSETAGFSQPRGDVEVALSDARFELLERVGSVVRTT